MFHTKDILNRMVSLNLLASVGFAVLLLLAQTRPALAATAPPLGLVQQFGALGGSGVTGAAGAGVIVNGDVGSSPTATITNFPPSIVTPPFVLHPTNDAVVQQARIDATIAALDLASQGPGTVLTAQLNGVTLTAGSYSFDSAADLAASGTLTLNGPGVFVFNVTSALTANVLSKVVGTADPCNVFWRVGTNATLSGDIFLGTVIAATAVTVGVGADVTGRVVAATAVTLAGNNSVTIAGCLLTTGAVVGTVFNDPNGSGVQESGESGIGGATVELVSGIVLDTTLTAGDGSYSFSSVAAGGYTVHETDPAGYISTTPNDVPVTVPAGGVAMANFGDQKQTVPRLAIRLGNPLCTACDTNCTDPNPHYVDVPHSGNLALTTGTGTIEAWIQATSCNASDANAGIVSKGNTLAGFAYGFGLAGGLPGTLFPGGTAQNIGFRLGGDVLVATGKTLTAGKWYHVACVWDNGVLPSGNRMEIYINGVLESPLHVAATTVPPNFDNLIIGRQNITPAQYYGVVEELRVWNTARTEADIREYMCKTLPLPPSLPVGLVYYLQFNEGGGAQATDPVSANNATLVGASRVCSEAPMGDSSDYDYTDVGGFTKTLNNAALTESLTATGTGVGWSEANKSGLQVYRVEDPPEPASGPMGSKLFGSRGYGGVFVTGGVDPTYTVTYNYDQAGIGYESNLDLMYRHHGCAPWMHLNVVPTPPTLVQTGLSGTEFILGKLVDPRNAIDFDGLDDVVTVSDSASLDLDLTTPGGAPDGTLEAWIYINTNAATGGIIHKGDLAAPPQTDEAYSLSLSAGSNIVLTIRDAGGATASVTNTNPLAVETWYHVAGVWNDNADDMRIYINGVLDSPAATTLTARTTTGGLNIGQQFTNTPGSNAPFDGYIDEVRVWNAARSQADIQTTMCKKVTSMDSGYANLMGYWRFDEENSLTNCPDYTAYNNDGTMTGFTTPVGETVKDARICSSAPIGDYSAFNYGGNLSTVTLNPTGDPFSATADSLSTWVPGSGIHVYRLDEAPVYGPDIPTSPNGLTPPDPDGIPGNGDEWSSVDYYRYFGVFVTDPTPGANQPSYTAVYNYANNPMAPEPPNDSVLGFARRDEFCDRTWADSGAALLVAPTNTLTVTGDTQNGTVLLPGKQNPEYILGGRAAPLAITLASFTATAADGCVDIAWETATEINTAGFHVWRSDNPLVGFVCIENRFVPSNAVAETMGAKYILRDCGVDFTGGKTYYYMLEEIEIDGNGTGNMHGPIGPVSENISAAQSTGGSSNSNCFIDSVSR